MQKVKHLEYENANSCEKVKEDGSKYEKLEDEANAKTEKDNLKEKKAEKTYYNENDRSNIGDIDTHASKLAKDNRELEEALEIKKKELIRKYEDKMEDLGRQLELRMKVEIHEIEERKNQHINELMISH